MATPFDAVSHSGIAAATGPGSAPPPGQEPAGIPPLSRAAETSALDHPHPLRIRPLVLTDIPAIVRMRGLVRLDVPESLVHTGSGRPGPGSALPILRRSRPTFVAVSAGQTVGFVRFSPRRPDGRWIVTAIAASTGVYDPEPVWDALLAYGVRTAGLKGVRRLFARVPTGHPLMESMQRAGWAAYGRETVFRADRPARVAPPAREMRPQEPADTWAIHQLYAAAVPRQVQEIEALTSHVWDMERDRRSRRSTRQSGWLLEEHGRLVGYVRFCRSARAGVIDAMAAPGDRMHFGQLLDAALSSQARRRWVPVYCALRGDLLDFQDELTSRGFYAVGEQELMIRYTTATVRTAATEPVLFPVELRPALPRRVPTFLEGQPTDGTA